MKQIKLGYGIYSFRDLNTKKKHLIRANNSDNAINKLNKKLGKKVNYTFLDWMRVKR